MIVPVILSGGSGTRLWPLSTPERPKQFLPLVSEHTLFEETLLRLQGIPGLSGPVVICNQAHRLLVSEQLKSAGVQPRAIVLEPEGRNTAPAIGVAAMIVAGTEGIDLQRANKAEPASAKSRTVLLILPADHVIADGEAFRESVVKAVEVARSGRLVTFGVVPTHPDTGYGYIERGVDEGDWHSVARFVEKPDAATAADYIDSARFLWNSGMFAFSTNALLAEFGKLAPDIIGVCERAVAGARLDDGYTWLGSAFLECTSDSIDYAVMEKTDRAAVVPLDAGWNDVGNWAALYAVLNKDAEGNAFVGTVVAEGCRETYVRASSRPVTVLGLSGVIVVETESAVLVLDPRHAQGVKSAQESVAKLRRSV